VGIDELRMQFAEDVVYVLSITDTFVIEQNGKFYSHETKEIDGAINAQVMENQTVYFNSVPAIAAELFDLDKESFRYVGKGVIDDDGIAAIDATNKNGSVTLLYTDTDGSDHTMGTIEFIDGEQCTFGGGTGTESVPYLIATAAQFRNIADDMDAHYRLVKNIDFGNVTIYPLGYNTNSVDSEVYDEFNGVLDGDGFTISKLSIQGVTNTGIFGKIGSEGTVKNLTISMVTIHISISEAKTSTSTFTGGILAGINNGEINSCTVEDSELTVESSTNNADAERSVKHKYGGVAGVNNGTIEAVMVENTKVKVSSTHEFGGASTSGNKNYVFAGGICGTCPGYLKNVGVDEYVVVDAYAKSVLNPKSTVNPYLKAHAGGITTDEGLDLENVENIYSAAKAKNIIAEHALKIQSGWGKHWKNASKVSDVLIPEKDEEDLKVEKSVIENAFAKDAVYNVSIVDQTEKYPAGVVELDREKLQAKVNGELVESFRIVSMYGFTGRNESYDQTRTENVKMLISTTVDEKELFLVGEFSITLDTNVVKSINLLNYETGYLKGQQVQTSGMVEVTDANGKKSTVNDAQFTIQDADTATAKIGTHKLKVGYQGASTEVEINVMCNIHFSNFDYSNPEHFTFVKSVSATCQHGGYDEYICAGCNETLKTNRTGVVDHNRVREVSTPATCAASGVIGKIYCTYCDAIFEEAVELPRLAHTFAHIGNADNHYCTTCNRYFAHDYVVSESLVDGKVTYTYTCYSCGYVGQEADTNIITNEENTLEEFVQTERHGAPNQANSFGNDTAKDNRTHGGEQIG
jgi:hypothetical protein